MGFGLYHAVTEQFSKYLLASASTRGEEIADGLINSLNLMMLNGSISSPQNRRLLLDKMSDSPGVSELRIIRAQQVTDQFGKGLPEETPADETDLRVLQSGKKVVHRIANDDGRFIVRVSVPFIASDNFRGTNCLACHHVRKNSVNGAASMLIDLSDEARQFVALEHSMLGTWLLIQLALALAVSLLVRATLKRHVENPIKELKQTISEIMLDKDLSRRAASFGSHGEFDSLVTTFNGLLSDLSETTEQLKLLAKVFQSSREAIIITDTNNLIVAVNPAFEELTGYSAREVIGNNPRMFKSGRQEASFYQRMWQEINTSGNWHGELWNRKKSGEDFLEWLSITRVMNPDNTQATHYVAIFIDITLRREIEQQVYHMAHHDALTGLPNRTLFRDRIKQALAAIQRNDRGVGLMYLDLDRFKQINDSLGHAVGDELLKEAAARLLKCVRDTDTVCRQGGDEFLILLPEAGRPDRLARIAEAIIDAMKKPFYIGTHELSISGSLGISVAPDDGVDSETLIKHADAAMYHAKKLGRNNYQFFKSDMNQDAHDRLILESHLKRAIHHRELFLVYQPLMDARNNRIVGMEALLRWNSEEHGPVPPSVFIPIAESAGLITEIGTWVLEQACIQNKRWQDAGLISVPVAVNLSAIQFAQKHIVRTIQQVLIESGLEARWLDLEITEGIAIDDGKGTLARLNELKAIGVRISIDDFGTGYSSLRYLQQYPIDKLKIDKSFVNDIKTGGKGQAIIKTIIGMGHSLGMKLVAEGVEERNELDFLMENGCDEIQGYYFSKPLSAAEFQHFALARKTSTAA